jgi:hypothetical protein
MKSCGYKVFDNERNLAFKNMVEDEIEKNGIDARTICDCVSRLENFAKDNQDEITMATLYIFKENGIEPTEFELTQLKVSIFHLKKQLILWDNPKLRRKYLLTVAEEFNVEFHDAW